MNVLPISVGYVSGRYDCMHRNIYDLVKGNLYSIGSKTEIAKLKLSL